MPPLGKITHNNQYSQPTHSNQIIEQSISFMYVKASSVY